MQVCGVDGIGRGCGAGGLLRGVEDADCSGEGFQRKFDEGHRTLDELRDGNGLAISLRVRVRYLLERGRLFNSEQNVSEAAPLFREAVNVATEAGEDFLAIDAAHMLGICLNGEEAIAWNERAIAMAEGATDASARVGGIVAE